VNETAPSAKNPLLSVLDQVGDRSRRPVLTGVVFAVTAVAGVVQLLDRPLFDLVRRDGAKIDDGEWWRLVTGMFFQDGWLLGLLFNLVALAVVGTLAERLFGRPSWAFLYFGCGLFGQAMSYLWLQPVGAGNSMCVAGLVGALTVVVLFAPSRWHVEVPHRLWLAGFLVPLLAVVDTVAGDNHGLPALLGMALAIPLFPARR
jgi:membrane associated rhomboid family serine protease